MKIFMRLVYQYMTSFFNFPPVLNHLHPLQVENCDSNSRLVVDEDDNGKFRLERVECWTVEIWSLATIFLISSTCNSVETAQPGDRTTDPDIVMPECYASSQRVDLLARVVITPVHHTHTRLHTPLSNICSSPSSLQHTRGLTSPACLLPQPYPQCSVLRSGLLVLHYR